MLEHRPVTAALIRRIAKLSPRRQLAPALLIALAVFVQAPRPSATQAQTQTYVISLSKAVIAASTPGQVTLTFEAGGDLRGLVTLRLDVDTSGVVTGGQWALVASYVQDMNPDGSDVDPSIDPHEQGEPHAEYIRFVDRGTLGGEVTGGTTGAGTNGALLVNVRLELSSGTLSFAAATTGSGTADADLGLTDAQGDLRLTL